MKIRVLNREPMNCVHYHTSYDVKNRVGLCRDLTISNLRHPTTKWMTNNANCGCREKPISMCQFGNMCLKFIGIFHLHKNKCSCNLVNTCKLDSGVKPHSEISKNVNIFYFLDMIYAEKKITHTIHLCTRNYTS
jgi:hypothetical protein